MSITVFVNQVRAGNAETDRLVTYQPSADASMDIDSCIDLVIAVKGRYSEDSGTSSNSRFNKFMAHLSFGRSEKVPSPGFESYQAPLKSLEIMVEQAKAEGLTDLHMWLLWVDPRGVNLSSNRFHRVMELHDQIEDMGERLGGTFEIYNHPPGLLKVELRGDEEFSSFDGVNTEQASDLPLATYQNMVRILRFPDPQESSDWIL